MEIPDISKINPLKPKKVPLHIAINASGLKEWQEKNQGQQGAAKKYVELLDELMGIQQKLNFPILTINLDQAMIENLEELKGFFTKLSQDESVHKNQTRIFILGKWYDLDPELVETLKKVMDETKDYDKFFVNFCLSYDGQEEIIAATRLLARKVAAGKMEAAAIDKTSIKENLYSSYFTPPDLIIECLKTYSGLLLWDSKGACIYFANKPCLEFTKKDFEAAINFCGKE
jgi:undecaprenyl diphosphate synthase